MLTFFLDNGADYWTFAGIGTIIAAFVGIGGLIITIRQNRDSNYLEFINNTDKTLSEHLERGAELDKADKNREDRLSYAYNYVDTCERILFLMNNGKVPKDFFDYYYDFLNYGLTMMWWYGSVYKEDRRLTKAWPLMTKWVLQDGLKFIKKKSIGKPDPYPLEHLPDGMIKEFTGDRDNINTTSIPTCNEIIVLIRECKEPNNVC